MGYQKSRYGSGGGNDSIMTYGDDSIEESEELSSENNDDIITGPKISEIL